MPLYPTCEECGEVVLENDPDHIRVHDYDYHEECFERCEGDCQECDEVRPAMTAKDHADAKADEDLTIRRGG